MHMPLSLHAGRQYNVFHAHVATMCNAFSVDLMLYLAMQVLHVLYANLTHNNVLHLYSQCTECALGCYLGSSLEDS